MNARAATPWALAIGMVFARSARAAADAPTPTPSPASITTPAPAGDDDLRQRLEEDEQAIDDLEKKVTQVKSVAAAASPGLSRFLLTGFGFSGFSLPEKTDMATMPGSFNAGFSPIFLWRPADKLIFEAEIEVELAEETMFDLEYAQGTYIVNNHLTLGAGKFLSPIGSFSERYHPAWINKLPESPLAFGHDGLAPVSIMGAQARGGTALGPIRAVYSAFVINGPTLELGAVEPGDVGMLRFESGVDDNKDKAVGGRIGFLPIPEIEIGYSVMSARVASPGTGTEEVGALLQDVDFAFSHDFAGLVTDVRAEWMTTYVGRTTYDPTGTLGVGPVTYTNRRAGGYGQLSLRPANLGPAFLHAFEVVGRFDYVDQPKGAPNGTDHRRITAGVDYWLSPSAVVKVAAQQETETDAADITVRSNTLLGQFAIGF